MANVVIFPDDFCLSIEAEGVDLNVFFDWQDGQIDGINLFIKGISGLVFTWANKGNDRIEYFHDVRPYLSNLALYERAHMTKKPLFPTVAIFLQKRGGLNKKGDFRLTEDEAQALTEWAESSGMMATIALDLG